MYGFSSDENFYVIKILKLRNETNFQPKNKFKNKRNLKIEIMKKI